jgi:23S rRNA-/tRNA-specific pseudouridylate synthase
VTAAIKLSSPATREFWEIPVLFEDEHLLALDKPVGLLTSPDPVNLERPSLLKLLHAGIADKKPWALEHKLDYLKNVADPDFETGGVLLLAKSKPAFLALADLASAGKIRTRYVTLVQGGLLEKSFVVDAKLSPHPVKPGMMLVDSLGGKKAETQFEVLETFPRLGYALLAGEPLFDRPHQVRVHASHVGLKVVGDQFYGGKPLWLSRLKPDYRLKPGHEEKPLIGRAALHVEQIILPHPVTNELVTIKTEWPKGLKVAVKYLRQYSL